MKIPRKISPCPITEAIMEVRFKSSIFSSAVFGVVYNRIKEEFPIVTKLPILTLPDQLRETEKNLVYLPHYKIESEKNKDIVIQIGPKVFSVAVINQYPGWEDFLKWINYGLDNLQKSSVVDIVERFALRYINVFDFDIYQKSNLVIKLDDILLSSENMDFRTEVKDGDLLNLIKINNNTIYKRASDPTKISRGSIIDIDTIVNKPVFNFFEIKDSLLEETHSTEKKWFFKLVSENYISSLEEVVY